jgi:SAM-dependent methyltransferase
MNTVDSAPLRLNRFASREDFLSSFDAMGPLYVRQRRAEEAFAAVIDGDEFWFECGACQNVRRLGLRRSPDAAAPINWRENAYCSSCQLNTRQRFALQRLRTLVPEHHVLPLYLTEQATPTYALAKRRFRHVLGSEFVVDEARQNTLTDYIREITGDANERLWHADVTRLSMASASVAAIGSFDVLEHVPDYRAALREFARVLTPGGTLLLSVPFLPAEAATRVLASIDSSGDVVHHCPPEYHGDPVNGDGALCFYHFGWDLLDALRDCGFSDVAYVTCWSLAQGLLGREGMIEAKL